MPDLTTVKPFDKYMALYVGGNGSGKSVAINSFMKLGSVYTFDFDNRMASVANWYQQRGLKSGQVSFDTYGAHNLYDAYTKAMEFKVYCPHAAIVFEGLTTMSVAAVMFSLNQKHGVTGKGAASKSKGGMIIPDMDDYKGETVFITDMLSVSLSLAAKGVAVFWTAHPMESMKVTAGTGGKVESISVQTKYAAYGNKVEALVPVYFNEIYSFVTEYDFQTRTNKRLCYTQPHDGINAKTALNLPSNFDWTDGDFYTIFKALADEGQAEAMRKGEEYKLNNPEVAITEEKKPFTF